jgi:trans-2,3-dihydro-3-hydroxyanthranilate isomerase
MDAEQREYVVLDVFTSRPLEGNALAVFTDGRGLDTAVMQRAARELHLSETVFVLDGDADCDAWVRIFTPAAEVLFAGHPVLGTAFLLAERQGSDRVRLGTGSGVITIELERSGGAVRYGEMVAPSPTVSPFGPAPELLEALGVGRAELPVEIYDNGLKHVCVTLASERAVAGLAPDLGALTRLGEICVSCFTAQGDRCKTRMFAPALGVAEDPATGSAAGPIALHLVRHGRATTGRRITISQGVEIDRPSTLFAQVDATDRGPERITVGGEAVRVARGTYRLQ